MRTSVYAAALVLVAVLGAAPLSAAGQVAPAVARAEALRNSGAFGQAAQLLRDHLAAHPDDGDAARLLAQTLYWMKDFAGARAEYDTALRRHPDDSTLRLQYARMLFETGATHRARELLTPLPTAPSTRAQAETLLGAMAFAAGDLNAAHDQWSAALADDPDAHEARQRLEALETATAPWIRIGGAAWHDDQPLDRAGAELEAGWYPAPLTSIAGHAESAGYSVGGSRRTIDSAGISVKNFAPALRLESELAIGAISNPPASGGWEWTGTAVAGVRLPAHVTVSARVERSRYLYTTASIDLPLMVRAAAAIAHLDHHGWLGEAAIERQHYPDENTIRTKYAWLLAPVVRRRGATVQAGYAFSTADAAESRFVLVNPVQPYAPNDPRFDASGRYVPYYTPGNVVTHAAIGSIAAGSARATLHLSGSYGFRATDDAPFASAGVGAGADSTVRRTFTPWDARASLSIAAGRRATLDPGVTFGHTAFYSWATAVLRVTVRFTPAAVRQHARP